MRSLLACVICFTTFDTILPVTSVESFPRIPLTRCCQLIGNETYNLLEDQCISVNQTELNQDQQFPEVFSMDGNTTRSLSFPQERFVVTTQNLSYCPDGYVARKSFSFLFLEDGSLMADEKKLNVGEFCVDQVFIDPDTTPVWMARYCVFEPCLEKPCIRKCCPNGMTIGSNYECQSSPSMSFNEKLHNERLAGIDPSLSFISDGVSIPRCEHGVAILQPYRHKNETFRILPDGLMVLGNHSHKAEQGIALNKSYCIDYMQSDENNEFELISFTCFPPPTEQPWSSIVVSYLLLFSSFFLVATFIVYCLIPEIRNVHGVSVMCHVASLTVTYIGLATIQLTSFDSLRVCIAVATIVHFAFLSVFTWLNVMSFGIWWALRDMRYKTGPKSGRPQLGWRMVLYSLYGWAIPTIFVLTGFILDNVEDLPDNIVRPRFGVSYRCWFTEREAFLAYLYGPIALFITSNILFFILTLYKLNQASNECEYATAKTRTKKKCRVIFGLFLLMGVSWMWEIISFAVGGDAAHWLITDVLNILTGVFIFFIFLCKPKIWGLLKLNYPRLKQFDPCCPAYMKIQRKNQTSTGAPITAVTTTKSKSTSTVC